MSNCNVCGCLYVGLAHDCKCTSTNWGKTSEIEDVPTVEHKTFDGTRNPPKMRKDRILESQMKVANAVEDHSDALLHAFIGLLIDLEYMTEPDVLKALEKFDESLQDSTTQTEP